MEGEDGRFTRQDGVIEGWRVIQPLLDARPPVRRYPRGSWGPPEADALVAGLGRWHAPWLG
jgi:glucose-6-phosphate 1-dehydrogenase